MHSTHSLCTVSSQLPGGIFSPSEIVEKLSHQFFLHFSFAMPTTQNIRGCLWTTKSIFFDRVTNNLGRDPYKKTPPDILHGGHSIGKDNSDYLAFKETNWLYRKIVYHSDFCASLYPRVFSPFKFAVRRWQICKRN